MSVRFQGDGAKFLVITLPSIPRCGHTFAQTNYYSFIIWLICGNKKLSYLIKEIGGVCAWRVGGQEARGPPQCGVWVMAAVFSFLLKQNGTEPVTYSYSELLS